jgi:hypothetical protein
MSVFLLDATRSELGQLAEEIGRATTGLLPAVPEREARRVAEDILFSRCLDRASCSHASECHAGALVWSLEKRPSTGAALCLSEPEVDDLPWIFASAVLDVAGLHEDERLRAAGILRALFRGALAPRLRKAEGCAHAR